MKREKAVPKFKEIQRAVIPPDARNTSIDLVSSGDEAGLDGSLEYTPTDGSTPPPQDRIIPVPGGIYLPPPVHGVHGPHHPPK